MRQLILSLILCTVAFSQLKDDPGLVTIARVKYGGGGDWYSDPSSLPNLIEFIKKNSAVPVNSDEIRVGITDKNFFSYPYLYLTGHGNIRFSEEEIHRLRMHLTHGGFLHADDNYGMDEYIRREMKRVFPDKEWIELPFDHEIYHAVYDFNEGLPKIHQHDGKPPRGLGIFHEGRLVVFYTYECDLGDGWEDPHVHNDPREKHLDALKMGTNIVMYALTH